LKPERQASAVQKESTSMDIRPHVIRAVFKRNFVSYFSSVIGYLFIVLFVGAGAIWAFNPEFFANNLATMDQLNRRFPWLLLFIVPAITMTTWAEEKKQGTDELLFTLPGTDLEILLGKYLAVLAIYTAAVVYSLLFCGFGVLTYLTYGNFDKGLLVSNFIGYWLAGGGVARGGNAGLGPDEQRDGGFRRGDRESRRQKDPRQEKAREKERLNAPSPPRRFGSLFTSLLD